MRLTYVVYNPFIAYKLTPGIQWVNKGYPNLITDSAPLVDLGGSTKIDSIQNAIFLRGDLHNAWDSYMFAVHPDVCIFHLSTVSVLTIFSDSAGM